MNNKIDGYITSGLTFIQDTIDSITSSENVEYAQKIINSIGSEYLKQKSLLPYVAFGAISLGAGIIAYKRYKKTNPIKATVASPAIEILKNQTESSKNTSSLISTKNKKNKKNNIEIINNSFEKITQTEFDQIIDLLNSESAKLTFNDISELEDLKLRNSKNLKNAIYNICQYMKAGIPDNDEIKDKIIAFFIDKFSKKKLQLANVIRVASALNALNLDRLCVDTELRRFNVIPDFSQSDLQGSKNKINQNATQAFDDSYNDSDLTSSSTSTTTSVTSHHPKPTLSREEKANLKIVKNFLENAKNFKDEDFINILNLLSGENYIKAILEKPTFPHSYRNSKLLKNLSIDLKFKRCKETILGNSLYNICQYMSTKILTNDKIKEEISKLFINKFSEMQFTIDNVTKIACALDLLNISNFSVNDDIYKRVIEFCTNNINELKNNSVLIFHALRNICKKTNSQTCYDLFLKLIDTLEKQELSPEEMIILTRSLITQEWDMRFESIRVCPKYSDAKNTVDMATGEKSTIYTSKIPPFALNFHKRSKPFFASLTKKIRESDNLSPLHAAYVLFAYTDLFFDKNRRARQKNTFEINFKKLISENIDNLDFNITYKLFNAQLSISDNDKLTDVLTKKIIENNHLLEKDELISIIKNLIYSSNFDFHLVKFLKVLNRKITENSSYLSIDEGLEIATAMIENFKRIVTSPPEDTSKPYTRTNRKYNLEPIIVFLKKQLEVQATQKILSKENFILYSLYLEFTLRCPNLLNEEVIHNLEVLTAEAKKSFKGPLPADEYSNKQKKREHMRKRPLIRNSRK